MTAFQLAILILLIVLVAVALVSAIHDWRNR